MKKNPIYIAIINTEITPNNESINLVYKWYKEINDNCKFLKEAKIINTKNIDKETFFNLIKDLIGKGRTSCCFYICEHGKQIEKENKDEGYEEYLKLNQNNYIKDIEFTNFINSLNIINKYIIMEVCHSGGLINEIKCDTNFEIPKNSLIISLCSKDEKCYYRTIYKDGKPYTYCYFSIFFAQGNINPLKEPLKALDLLKRNKKYNIHPKLILVNEDY